jgi:aminoglycoside phosphotransferase (APT) family kinase protein
VTSSDGVPAARGVGVPWEALPPEVRGSVESVLGARPTRVRQATGGFSPGFTGSIFAGDTAVFTKATAPALNPDSPAIYAREADIVSRLPAHSPVPRLLARTVIDPGGWAVLVFEHVDGRNPETPWRPPELQRVLAALENLSSALTPDPIGAPEAAEAFSSHIRGWNALRESGPDLAPEWAKRHLDRLCELEDGAPDASRGDTLLHFDLRADNIVLAPDQVYFVDWPHAARGGGMG